MPDAALGLEQQVTGLAVVAQGLGHRANAAEMGGPDAVGQIRQGAGQAHRARLPGLAGHLDDLGGGDRLGDLDSDVGTTGQVPLGRVRRAMWGLDAYDGRRRGGLEQAIAQDLGQTPEDVAPEPATPAPGPWRRRQDAQRAEPDLDAEEPGLVDDQAAFPAQRLQTIVAEVEMMDAFLVFPAHRPRRIDVQLPPGHPRLVGQDVDHPGAAGLGPAQPEADTEVVILQELDQLSGVAGPLPPSVDRLPDDPGPIIPLRPAGWPPAKGDQQQAGHAAAPLCGKRRHALACSQGWDRDRPAGRRGGRAGRRDVSRPGQPDHFGVGHLHRSLLSGPPQAGGTRVVSDLDDGRRCCGAAARSPGVDHRPISPGHSRRGRRGRRQTGGSGRPAPPRLGARRPRPIHARPVAVTPRSGVRPLSGSSDKTPGSFVDVAGLAILPALTRIPDPGGGSCR